MVLEWLDPLLRHVGAAHPDLKLLFCRAVAAHVNCVGGLDKVLADGRPASESCLARPRSRTAAVDDGGDRSQGYCAAHEREIYFGTSTLDAHRQSMRSAARK